MAPQRSLFTLRPALALAAFIASTATSFAWWNDAWTVRRQITIDASVAGSANEAARPVLVRLHDGNFQFLQAMEDGADIRFVGGDDKTVLPHHIERFDPLLNEAFVWVDVQGLKPGAKADLWLYYGHEARSAPRVDDAKTAYDDDTALVYHFAGAGAPVDSSKNARNANNAALPVEGSLIGPGQRFSGTETIHVPASPALLRDAARPLTFSAWVKAADSAGRQVLFSWGQKNSAVELFLEAGAPVLEIRDGARSVSSTPAAALPADNWRHLAFVADSASVILYVDGQEYGRVAAPLPALEGELTLGAAGGRNGFVGEIDEVQISTVARSAAWLRLAALAESGSTESQKIVVFGAEETAGGGGHNATLEHVMLFGDIARNMMFDGWIAVGCCIIMMVVGWVVAIRKFRYLKRVEKGTAEFLRRWKEVSYDLTVIDHTDAANVKSLGGVADAELQAVMQTSPLYQIYHVGSEEIHHRIKSKKGFHGLSARSITAIKASLDASQTREVHRLNSGLVSLTIGIAGGPYVGLMGTVVGVMITFAVIAKTGQVEVNSIAPGIASALLATVFGLLVAIPALFLYSFLNSRIKDAVSEMQLFIDEFITKMAEFYPVAPGAADSTTAPFGRRDPGRTESDDEIQEAVRK